MTNIYCPKCKKLLMKAKMIDAEIKCKGCNRIVHVEMYSYKSLLTAEKKANKIKAIETE